MDAREEAMRECGVHECPPWCLRDAEEGDYQFHYGAWEVVVEDGPLAVELRPTREWWTDGEESDCSWSVMMRVRDARSGTFVDVDLDDDAIDDLRNRLEAHRDVAVDELNDDWPEAFPGAADIEAARVAALNQEEDLTHA